MNKTLTKNWQKRVVYLLVSTLFASLIIWTIYLWKNLPGDDIRYDITLDEAQNLVSFPICIPNNLLQEIDPEPEIIYDADDANVPDVTYIRLRYKKKEDQKLVFEVFQVFTKREELEEIESEFAQESAKIKLLYWMIPYHELLFRPVDTITETIKISVSSHQNEDVEWGLYEITSPNKYRSTMTEWISNHVEYRIMSYLPAEEIKKVTISMFQCIDHHNGD